MGRGPVVTPGVTTRNVELILDQKRESYPAADRFSFVVSDTVGAWSFNLTIMVDGEPALTLRGADSLDIDRVLLARLVDALEAVRDEAEAIGVMRALS